MGEKNSSCSVFAGDAGLFPCMKADKGHFRSPGTFAKRPFKAFRSIAIRIAQARTKITKMWFHAPERRKKPRSAVRGLANKPVAVTVSARFEDGYATREVAFRQQGLGHL